RGKKVVIAKSGVGKVFSAMICQKLIDKYNISNIIFTGVAGSLNSSLEIGDVVVSTDSCHHDLDAQALGFKRGQIPYTDLRFFKAEEKLVELALTAKIPGHKILAGRILTGEQFITHKVKQEKKKIFEELEGMCIEMEGASVAQVCNVNSIPHIIIRSISDKSDSNSVADFDKFKFVVAENSYKIVEHILEKIA
ncbi:MAG: 5'-methylthioadenosine/adenosylhomocysteine nucleosidase, partial [Candidatus Diapherotrites archaeon]|nr:5'-methylthioadenosine/adenosylhomocysteine nucleosidase [Candidatus Diapherotrites archaeon]